MGEGGLESGERGPGEGGRNLYCTGTVRISTVLTGMIQLKF